MSASNLSSDASLPFSGAQAEGSRIARSRLSKTRFWAGWTLTALTGLFMLFDAAGKFLMPRPVIEAFVRLGFPTTLGTTLGVLLLISTVLYLIPRTAVLGAVLLSGYLGGAVSIQLRAGSPTFETIFPVLFALLSWVGIYLRERRLAALVPLRS